MKRRVDLNIASAVQESHKPTLNNPWPDQTYRSPKYWEALRHAAAEAQRLGLEIGLHNTVGYSTTGGPWIDEEKNMQNLVSKSITVEGGKRISIDIPRPDPTAYRGYGSQGLTFTFFRDIAVLAVPASGDIDPSKAIDLTQSFKNNHLDWDAPEGSCPHQRPKSEGDAEFIAIPLEGTELVEQAGEHGGFRFGVFDAGGDVEGEGIDEGGGGEGGGGEGGGGEGEGVFIRE